MAVERRKRPHLIEDSAPVNEEEDSLQFLWAVSYSDLLMVLICFFVIYFNMDDRDPAALDQIFASMRGKESVEMEPRKSAAGAGGPGGSVAAVGEGRGTASIFDAGIVTTEKVPAYSAVIANIQKKFAEKYHTAPDGQVQGAMLIHFPDNFYGLGQVEITSAQGPQLDEIYEILRPYQDRIMLTFVGHADEKPVRGLYRSNLVLSNIRASHAAENAISRGFDRRFVSTEGFAEFGRGTRSVSLRIRERGTR